MPPKLPGLPFLCDPRAVFYGCDFEIAYRLAYKGGNPHSVCPCHMQWREKWSAVPPFSESDWRNLTCSPYIPQNQWFDAFSLLGSHQLAQWSARPKPPPCPMSAWGRIWDTPGVAILAMGPLQYTVDIHIKLLSTPALEYRNVCSRKELELKVRVQQRFTSAGRQEWYCHQVP
jgi:hypothetical protein